jgi:hypothetical protein
MARMECRQDIGRSQGDMHEYANECSEYANECSEYANECSVHSVYKRLPLEIRLLVLERVHLVF